MTSTQARRSAQGYTLIELLVVLVIVGVLAIASVQMIGNRPASSVRSLMDELEGVIAAAHKSTTSTLGDITLTASGNWTAATPATLTYTGATGQADQFVYNPSSRVLQYAAIDCGSGWSNDARDSLAGVVPFSTTPAASNTFLAAIASSAQLFKSGNPAPVINGYSKTANSGFYIAVVGMRNGAPISGGPVGFLVMPAGSGTVYKFYRSSSADSWRRL
ncbi:MAG TPA: prepilin-type N-terminal cleavage/methylation domain-containing protein [Holophagaceae bacterium]